MRESLEKERGKGEGLKEEMVSQLAFIKQVFYMMLSLFLLAIVFIFFTFRETLQRRDPFENNNNNSDERLSAR